MPGAAVRLTLDLLGVLQGVGFRPTVARIAARDGVSGWVQNRSGTVRLVLEGAADQVEYFVANLPARLPPRARLESVVEVAREAVQPGQVATGFAIVPSAASGPTRVSIPADLAPCPDCARDVLDPGSRFFGYPFTTCTNCGPRYTVVEGMPYDRQRTTLREFPLCRQCRSEYHDPADRRFHAESIACPVCGPRLRLYDAAGLRVDRTEPLSAARTALADGCIVAVRGIGGYLLAADSFNAAALGRLRHRKARPHKPLAVMARNLDAARRFCRLPDCCAALLASPTAPIAVLDADLDACAAAGLPLALLAPGMATLGVMLPASPLHLLLAEPLPGDPTPPFELLVMTSGNRRGEPICLTDAEATERLSGIADLFLGHDREIALRNDDSLCTHLAGEARVLRRARGYAPMPVRLPRPLARPVLAMGAQLKNAIALGFDDAVMLSPHVGDLETPEALDGLLQVVQVFPDYFARAPQAVAVDLHPDLRATRVGRDCAARYQVPVVEVQHHHAHAVACMAEHGVEEALALVFDGVGLGADGSLWGGELLYVSPTGFTRQGTFAGVPLPGGDAAVQRPARQAAARLLAAGVLVGDELRQRLGLSATELAAVRFQCGADGCPPVTHAVGRAFDAFAALIGVAPAVVTYEGQAAAWLEAVARAFLAAGGAAPTLPYAVGCRGGLVTVDLGPLFAEVAALSSPHQRAGELAAGFHGAIAQATLELVSAAAGAREVRAVALSGGVMVNRILVEALVAGLRRLGFSPLLHRTVPPGDGGVALGQAVVAGGGL